MDAASERQSGVVFFFWMMVLSGLALFGMILGSAFFFGEGEGSSRAHERGDAADDGLLPRESAFHVPAFALEDANGGTLSREDLLGSVWVADLIFTNCTAQCATMTESMARLQERLADLEGTRLVSISVDPERDTAEVLRAYGQRHGAEAGRWAFLRGASDAVRRLSVEGFKLGSLDDILLHSSRFVLVDRAGRIRGWYDGMSAREMERLARHVRRLLAEPAS